MKVLCVDDSSLFRHTLRKQLEALGYSQVLECENTQDARNMIEGDPDIVLVISDHYMDQGSGLEFLRWVREHTLSRVRDMHFLMVSGEQSRDLILESAQLGVTGYLVKPLQIRVLSEKLKRLVPLGIKASSDFVEPNVQAIMA